MGNRLNVRKNRKNMKIKKSCKEKFNMLEYRRVFIHNKRRIMKMDNNQFYPAKNSTKELFKWIGLGCSSFGCLLTVIFSIFTCSRGSEKLTDAFSDDKLKMSLAIIGVIIGVLIAIAGLVLSILSIEKGEKINKIVMISVIVAVVAIVWGIIPNATICGYNCMINNKIN